MCKFVYYIVTRITRTSKCQVLDCYTMFATLLVLAPNHGQVTYKCNARTGVWNPIEVPPHTCLLYVDQAGDYRCQMGGQTFYFTILWRGRSACIMTPNSHSLIIIIIHVYRQEECFAG